MSMVLATQKTFELADAVLELAGFRSRNDVLVGSNGFLAAFAHQPSPPEHQARREPMATGNIADRHARLHRLGDHGKLLIHRKPSPAGDAVRASSAGCNSRRNGNPWQPRRIPPGQQAQQPQLKSQG
jgi:hypothetical protein